GVAADHELLARAAFSFDPFARAAGDVETVAALADDSFQALFARGAMELPAVARDVVAEANRGARPPWNQGRERALALLERHRAKVAAVPMEQVEDVVEDRKS